jgi:hypothetical protein
MKNIIGAILICAAALFSAPASAANEGDTMTVQSTTCSPSKHVCTVTTTTYQHTNGQWVITGHRVYTQPFIPPQPRE